MAEIFTPGRFYDRLCIRASWPDGTSKPQWWPVHGPLHEDREIIGFPHQHYHIDWRFLNKRQRESASAPERLAALYNVPITAIVLSEDPIKRAFLSERPPADPGSHQYARTKRLRYHGIPWPPGGQFLLHRWYAKLAEAYREHSLKPGLICPHRGADLSGIAPQDGIIICPMHGLQWHAQTGTLHVP